VFRLAQTIRDAAKTREISGAESARDRAGKLILSLPQFRHEAGNIGKNSPPGGALFKGDRPDRFSDGGKQRASRNQLARSGMHLFTASLRARHFRRQTRD
jgi:hypothetical protein